MRRHRTNATRKPGLAPGFFLCAALAGCEAPPANDDAHLPVRITADARVDDGDLSEISGIAGSLRDPEILWVHNDSGDKARLYAIDRDGRTRGRLWLTDSDNDDWEDLASFAHDGRAYLLVADIGDNEASRDEGVLYVVAEPDLAADDRVRAPPAWRVRFRYPDGPRDAEAVLVDGDRVLILSKRDLPPVLYSVPLRADGTEPVVATRLGPVTSLPRPTRAEVDMAPVMKDWHWQPTGMAVSPRGDALVVLTYGALYFYRRGGHADWPSALAELPLRMELRSIRDAEAVAFVDGGQTLYVTVEQPNAPLVRIDLLAESRETQ